MNNTQDNLQNPGPLFEKMKDDKFLFSVQDALHTITTPPPPKPFLQTLSAKIIIVMSLFSISAAAFLWLSPLSHPAGHQQLSNGHQITVNYGDSVKKKYKKALVPPTPPAPPALPSLPALPDIPSIPGLPHVPTPPKPPVPPVPPVYEIPSMDGWSISFCPKKQPVAKLNPLKTNVPEIDSTSLVELSDEEYGKLGIHKTKGGVYLDLGSIVCCYNRYGTYHKPLSVGKLIAPIPVAITDREGNYFRSYYYNAAKMAQKRKEIAEHLPSREEKDVQDEQIVMSSLNSLIPVLVRNSSDTSKGVLDNDIIAWYDPGDFVFQGILDKAIKEKLLKGTSDNDKPTIVLKTESQQPSKSTCQWTDFKVYPNPVSSNFSLQFNLLEDKRIKINLYDIQGRPVKILKEETAAAKGQNSYDFDISSLSEGIYILAVQATDGEMWTQRIILK